MNRYRFRNLTEKMQRRVLIYLCNESGVLHKNPKRKEFIENNEKCINIMKRYVDINPQFRFNKQGGQIY